MNKLPIANLSQFKKSLKVGMMVHCYHHHYGDMGIRPLVRVQSNAFALKTVRTTGEEVESWCQFPKASECDFNENSMTINCCDCGGREPWLTYSLLAESVRA